MRAEIVEIKKEDLGSVKNIIAESWSEEEIVLEKMQKIEESLFEGNNLTHFVCIAEGNSVVGVIGAGEACEKIKTVVTNPINLGEISCFYIKKSHQNKGIGTKLFSKGARFLFEKGYTGIALSSGDKFKETFNFYRERIKIEPIKVSNYFPDGRDANVWCGKLTEGGVELNNSERGLLEVSFDRSGDCKRKELRNQQICIRKWLDRQLNE